MTGTRHAKSLEFRLRNTANLTQHATLITGLEQPVVSPALQLQQDLTDSIVLPRPSRIRPLRTLALAIVVTCVTIACLVFWISLARAVL